MADDVNDFIMGNSTPSASFLEIGRTYEGRILEWRMVQQRDFKTKELKFWPEGTPMMQAAITIQTDEHDSERDDGRRVVYAKAKLREALANAVRDSGSEQLELGGTIKVRYEADDPETNAKLYKVKYLPPDPLYVESTNLDSYGDESAF